MNKTEAFHSGFISIIGRPNVGKSSVMNAMLGEKLAIVSAKPQTTRTRMMGIMTANNAQMVFLDTPGVHEPRTKLGELMMKSVRDALDGSDCILMILDVSHITKNDRELVESYLSQKVPCVLALNKTDLVRPETVLASTAEFADAGFADIVPVSAKTGDGIGELSKCLFSYLPEGPQYFPDDMITDQPERVLCAEIIREKALLNLQEEVPHGIGVEIMQFTQNSDSFADIQATVYCERESHKAIIIGKHGSMLKRIGSEARADIEKLLGIHVNLNLWVKVKNDWRNRPSELKNLGYDVK